MPALSVNDLQRAWLIDQLGLSAAQAATYTINDLENLLYGVNGTGVGGIANNRRFSFNNYYGVENAGGNTTVAAPVLNDLNAFPFIVGRKQNFDRLSIAVTTAATAASGAVVRLGLYDTANNGNVQNLLASVGPISIESTGNKEGTIAVTLNPGLYWLAAVAQVSVAGPPAFRGITAAWSPYVSFNDPTINAVGCGYIQTGVTGALPSPFVTDHSSTGIYSGALHRIMLRAS